MKIPILYRKISNLFRMESHNMKITSAAQFRQYFGQKWKLTARESNQLLNELEEYGLIKRHGVHGHDLDLVQFLKPPVDDFRT